jgi:YjbE family integral membrane protein
VQDLYSIFVIIIINLVLSGDNAVVIGMAARRLPARERRIAIVLGGLIAIVLRIVLTVLAARLLQLSGLRIGGGILLIWIGFKLLKEEEAAEGVKAATSMRDAVMTILVADLVMSTDNVLGVAAASHNNDVLLIFGLVGSMAIILGMGSIVANLINRFAWLSYVGAAVIIWTGALMIFDDPVIARRAWISHPIEYISAAAITVAVTLFAHWFHRVRESS